MTVRDMRPIFSVVLFIVCFVAPSITRADSPQRPQAAKRSPAQEEENIEKRDDDRGVNIGLLGGVGFPRPLAIEPVVRLGRYVMIGAEYSVLPKVTFGSVDTRMWAAAGDFRFFPFKDGFFIGLRAGYQELTTSTTWTAANVGSYTESVDVGNWFLNPRIGFLWVWKPFALGIDGGAQIPILGSVTRSSRLAAIAPEVDASLARVSNTFARTIIPTIDLLRIGLVF